MTETKMDNTETDTRISRNRISRYEKAKIIGIRMEQLARGAQPTVDITGLKTVREIALKEYEEDKMPFMIARTLTNGTKEIWKLEELIE